VRFEGALAEGHAADRPGARVLSAVAEHDHARARVANDQRRGEVDGRRHVGGSPLGVERGEGGVDLGPRRRGAHEVHGRRSRGHDGVAIALASGPHARGREVPRAGERGGAAARLHGGRGVDHEGDGLPPVLDHGPRRGQDQRRHAEEAGEERGQAAEVLEAAAPRGGRAGEAPEQGRGHPDHLAPPPDQEGDQHRREEGQGGEEEGGGERHLRPP
jgi:hypothetical protein